MKKFLAIILFFAACKTKPSQVDNGEVQNQVILKDISDPTNTLNAKTETLVLNYIVWGCACANWMEIADFRKFEDNQLADHCIFIEPAHDSLQLPNYFDPSRHSLKVIGQFYTKPDYPKGTVQTEERLEKAKVFRYTKIEVIDRPNFKPKSKIETLTLDYNAIACTCAQWSESKYSNKPDKKVYYWLEPNNKKLIQADTLYNGENLPVQIKVTGQIVSENGFPKIDLSKVGQDEAGKVFRYTKIEILKNGRTKNGY
jgi:hypothetical protein